MQDPRDCSSIATAQLAQHFEVFILEIKLILDSELEVLELFCQGVVVVGP